MMQRLWPILLLAVLAACTGKRPVRVLYYTSNNDHHTINTLQEIVEKQGGSITLTGRQQYFREDSLEAFSAVCLPLSLADSLDHRSITALKRYLEAGGGLLIIRDSAHHQQGWPWLAALNNSPLQQPLQQDAGRLYVLPDKADRANSEVALRYITDGHHYPDYKKAQTPPVPDSSRFTYMVLGQGLDEPMQMDILPNGNVLFVERKGAVKLYDARARQTKAIGRFNVFSGIEDGLLGVALDPDFASNHRVYFYYAPAGDTPVNRLSRLEMHGDTLLPATEKVILEIPTQHKYCCHSAGYIFFGPGGLLYLSTGDNTNAEETEGYTPVDERSGHELADDQASSASSMDLRGKILRIKPNDDGSYAIPDGNLFPKDGKKGRPEIYVMGCRNPYRFTVDMKNAFVYWGDIGPDTKVPSAEGGTLSFDEINQARRPGFFGWPYFNGNNEAYPLWDFAAKKERPKKDPQQPLNVSRNNRGVQELPPAQPAMIWYGDGASQHFPLVGKGGESAMAGPVYYSDLFPNAPYRLPEYYNGKLFIYDWVRHWIMAVTFDKDHRYLRMEPFLDHLSFSAPVDIKFAADGSLYVLEYGTNWFAKNNDARLLRITYAEGNRQPIANIQASRQYGAAPLTVQLSAKGSIDYDKTDQLSYEWNIGGAVLKGETVSHTFRQPGAYNVTLTVTDDKGGKGTSVLTIKAGNTPPAIDIATTANRSFYWNNSPLDYRVTVTDPEDGSIDSSRVSVYLHYLAQGKDLALALANTGAGGTLRHTRGSQLTASLDCKSCHALNSKSIGPSFLDIATRYAGKDQAAALAQKIIHGGSGNWGKYAMSAHPDLSLEDARGMVQYILAVNEKGNRLPLQQTLTLKEHTGKGHEGMYLLTAAYTDKGAHNIEPLSARSHLGLRDPQVQIEDYDGGNVSMGTVTTLFLTYGHVQHNNFVRFNQLDLTHIRQLTYRALPQGAGGRITLHLDKPDGPVVSSADIPGGRTIDLQNGWKEITAPVQATTGLHDLYFVFTNAEAKKGLFGVDWIYFGK